MTITNKVMKGLHGLSGVSIGKFVRLIMSGLLLEHQLMFSKPYSKQSSYWFGEDDQRPLYCLPQHLSTPSLPIQSDGQNEARSSQDLGSVLSRPASSHSKHGRHPTTASRSCSESHRSRSQAFTIAPDALGSGPQGNFFDDFGGGKSVPTEVDGREDGLRGQTRSGSLCCRLQHVRALKRAQSHH